MSIDLNKYDNIIFHRNEVINKKIKAYMIIFDYQCDNDGLSLKGKVDLFNKWEGVFMDEEFYEIIPCLIYRKRKLEVQTKYDNLSVIGRMAYKLSDIIESLGNKRK